MWVTVTDQQHMTDKSLTHHCEVSQRKTQTKPDPYQIIFQKIKVVTTEMLSFKMGLEKPVGDIILATFMLCLAD